MSLLAILVWFNVARSRETDARWDRAKETALRSLIAKENVKLELYYSEGEIRLPLHRLHVPDAFIDLYKSSPIDCLTVLASIVEHGNGHDALVAFQFGCAGDEPQIAIPLFAYVSSRELDEPVAKGETYRQCCLRIVRNKLDEKKRPNR
jgi:hypothetical protein